MDLVVNTPAPLVTASPRMKEAGGMMQDREAAFGGAGVANSEIVRAGRCRIGEGAVNVQTLDRSGTLNHCIGQQARMPRVWPCNGKHAGKARFRAGRHIFQLPFGAWLRERRKIGASLCGLVSGTGRSHSSPCRFESGPQPTITRSACPAQADGRGGAFRISKRRPASASLHAGHMAVMEGRGRSASCLEPSGSCISQGQTCRLRFAGAGPFSKWH